MSAPNTHSIESIQATLANLFPESLECFEAIVEWADQNNYSEKTFHEYLTTGSIFRLRELIDDVCKFGYLDDRIDDTEQLEMYLNTIDEAFHEQGDTQDVLNQMLCILNKRWPESIPVINQVIERSKQDSDYAKRFNHYLLHGSTLQIRDLTEDFGDYWHKSDYTFFNNVNAIDSSHAIVLPYSIKKWGNGLRKRLSNQALPILDKMMEMIKSDDQVARLTIDYFSNGSKIKLMKLLESMEDTSEAEEAIEEFYTAHRNYLN